jgi:hypothetical protein
LPVLSITYRFQIFSSFEGIPGVYYTDFLLGTETAKMESKNGSTNKRGTSDSNSSPKRNVVSSSIKKRKHGKTENGWFSTKSFFFGLIIAFVAWMFSQYWTDILPNINSNSGKSTSGSDQPKPSESQNEVKHIDLPLGFIPSCSIKGKESISAINRAKTDSCKQRIAELACRSVDASDGIGNLYPTHLPNFCPTARTHNPELAGQYLGKLVHKKLRGLVFKVDIIFHSD